ncbi:hypothetical protein [Paraburkholderia sp. BCC1884]|nr:hypothetical protein [Paraburkholderia sp. BCC1884]
MNLHKCVLHDVRMSLTACLFQFHERRDRYSIASFAPLQLDIELRF